ncbi:unnamed protein product, partial [marine sediment metagenome]
QDIMLETGKEVEEGMYGPMLEEESACREGMIEKGVEIYTLPADEAARWREKIRPIWDEWAAKSPGCAELLELAEETR